MQQKAVVPFIVYGNTDYKEHTILFTGDIMLAREVERIMEKHGKEYPFMALTPLLQNADIVVGNFEGSVPEIHVETPDFGFQFSVPQSAVGVLQKVGFTHLSLANNHTYDFGHTGYKETQVVCLKYSITCFGDREMSTSSYTILESNGLKVGILALDLTTAIAQQEVLLQLDLLTKESDVQIASVHWGEEYVEMHNAAQEKWAHFLIDNGIDAIVGHHPHVVQDIAVYKNAPIFYSLGNLIFDQYFDDAVQEGMLVQLAITYSSLRYTLIPVSSVETPSQPHIMGLDEKDQFLDALFIRSGISGKDALYFSQQILAKESIISTMRAQ